MIRFYKAYKGFTYDAASGSDETICLNLVVYLF